MLAGEGRGLLAPRVLVCIEDTGVAHVVAARLMKDGVDGVVVDKPNRLVEEAKKGVSALAVQDRYPRAKPPPLSCARFASRAPRPSRPSCC
jgi:hypothetical protein